MVVVTHNENGHWYVWSFAPECLQQILRQVVSLAHSGDITMASAADITFEMRMLVLENTEIRR